MKVLKALGYLILVVGLNSCALSIGAIELASVTNVLPVDVERELWYLHRDYSLMTILSYHAILFAISTIIIKFIHKEVIYISFPITLFVVFVIITPINSAIKDKIIVPKYELLGAYVLNKFPNKTLNKHHGEILGLRAVTIINEKVQKDVELHFSQEMKRLNISRILVNDSTVYLIKYTCGLGMEAVAYSYHDICGGEDRSGKAYVLPCKKLKKRLYDISFFDA